MRKIALSIAAAGAALVAASPAAAQYYPAPQPAPYGHGGYGFEGNWGETRALHERIENIERQIGRLERVWVRQHPAGEVVGPAIVVSESAGERAPLVE